MPIRRIGQFAKEIHRGEQRIVKVYHGSTLVWEPRLTLHRLIPYNAQVQYYNVPAGIGRIRGLIIGSGGARGTAGAAGASVSDRRRVRKTRQRCWDVPTRTPYTVEEPYQATCPETRTRRVGCRQVTDCPSGEYHYTTYRHSCLRGQRCRYTLLSCSSDESRDGIRRQGGRTYTRCCRTVWFGCQQGRRRGACKNPRTRTVGCRDEPYTVHVPCTKTRPVTRYRTGSREECEDEDYYVWEGSTTSGGAGGAGGLGGHGFYETFDETVSEGDTLRITFRSNGNVQVSDIGDWDYEADAGGRGGRGGNGGRGNGAGSDGSAGASVTTVQHARTYAGGPGGRNQGNRGGTGGAGASGIKISSQHQYLQEVGPLPNPFSFVMAGDGYNAEGPVRFTAIGRGQSARSGTRGIVYLFGTKS